MKKTILFFAALAVMVPFAFAAHHFPWEDPAMCSWRMAEGLSVANMNYCERLGVNVSNSKCCWKNFLCENLTSPQPWPTCESMIEEYGEPNWFNHGCCWNSRENLSILLKKSKGNDKGGTVHSPKGKKGNAVQPVKANTANAPAQANAQTNAVKTSAQTKVQVQKKTIQNS